MSSGLSFSISWLHVDSILGPIVHPFWGLFWNQKVIICLRYGSSLFFGSPFYFCLEDFGIFLRCVFISCCLIIEKCEIVKISTTLETQLDFQGLAGFGSVCFVLLVGVSFLDGFGMFCLVIWGWMLGAFWLPKPI